MLYYRDLSGRRVIAGHYCGVGGGLLDRIPDRVGAVSSSDRSPARAFTRDSPDCALNAAIT